MSQARTFIFDFDGTLADTFGIAVSIFRKLAPKDQPTDDATVEQLRGMSAKAAIKHLGVRWWQLPYLVYYGRKSVREQIGNVKAYPGVAKAVRAMHEQGVQLFVVSSNSTKNIESFLKRNKLEDCFDAVYGGRGLFDKSAALVGIVKKNQLDITDCVYVGDEVRDIEAARRAGMRCISVTWGYNNRQALEAAKAETLADDPMDLLSLSKKPD
jgi:phosphoglycolate phosphatase-like HAD superfamily hydrolase